MRHADKPTVQGWRPEDPRSAAPLRPPGPDWRGGPGVRLLATGDRSRFRLGVLGRAALVSPHTALLELWWIVVPFAVTLAWLCALVAGRVPRRLHRFLSALVRYQTRVAAYGLLLADPFPGFNGRTTYPFDLELAGPRRHSRARALLYLPIVFVLGLGALALAFVMLTLVQAAWVWGVLRGRVPRWYQEAGTVLVAFIAQALAFALMVTDRTPAQMRLISGPAEWHPTPLPEPRPAGPRRSLAARLGVLAGLALLVVGAARAGHLLWHTKVPENLEYPHLKPTGFFQGDALAANGRAEDRADMWFLAAQVASILGLVIFAVRGRGLARHSAAGPIGTGMFLGMLGIGWAALVAAPFMLFGLLALPPAVDTGPIAIDIPVEAMAQMTNVAFVVCIAMAVARRLPRQWIVPAPLLITALLGATVLLVPGLGIDAPKLKDPVLLADAHKLAAREGIPNAHIDYLDDRDRAGDTPTPTNAFAAGGGTSADIVLEGSLRSRRELRAVLAHEIAHVARRHERKSIAWEGLFLLAGALLVQLVIRRRGDLYNPALVPLALVVFSVAQLAWTPLQVGVSRRYEAEADWVGLQANRDPEGQISLMRELAIENDAPATRPWWANAMFGDHPDTMRRIEMAAAWQRLHPR